MVASAADQLFAESSPNNTRFSIGESFAAQTVATAAPKTGAMPLASQRGFMGGV